MLSAARFSSTVRLRYGKRPASRFTLHGQRLESRLPLVGDFVSALSLGGSGLDHVIDIEVDAAGNQYLAGEFHNTVDFDPGPGETSLTALGEADAFLAKYDAAHTLLWAKAFGGSADDRLNSLVLTDAGQVLLSGAFAGTVDFDPGSGTQTRVSHGLDDAYLLSLTTAGEFDWVQTLGGGGPEEANHVAVDTQHAYVAGSFSGTVDFDPGPGQAPLTSAGLNDAFFAKYTLSGQFVWAQSLGGSNREVAERVAVTSTGNLIVAGQFRGPIDFDPGPSVHQENTNGGYDLFVSSFDSTGSFQWVATAGASGSDTVADLVLDSQDNIITTGAFYATVDFDPGPGTSSQYAGNNSGAYVWKLDSQGAFSWVEAYRGGIQDSVAGTAVAVDPRDQIFVTGHFTGEVNFAGTSLSTFGGTDVYVAKFDNPTGEQAWLRRVGGINFDFPSAVATDSTGHVLVGGFFVYRADLDPGSSTHFVDDTGGGDAFLLNLLDEPPPSGGWVVARHVFYNNSTFDGSTAAASELDDEAIATDKQALLPGQTASFANYTSYSRGVNGVMVDLAGMATPTQISASDFLFRMGNSHDLSTWTTAPAPLQIKVREGAGENGSDRVTLIFADRAITGTWLEVTVRSTLQTGLPVADKFYLGNAIGESGNDSTTNVDASDFQAVRSNARSFLAPVALTHERDFNRDTLVNASDLLLVRDHASFVSGALVLISPQANSLPQSEGEFTGSAKSAQSFPSFQTYSDGSEAMKSERSPPVRKDSPTVDMAFPELQTEEALLAKQLARDALFAEWNATAATESLPSRASLPAHAEQGIDGTIETDLTSGNR